MLVIPPHGPILLCTQYPDAEPPRAAHSRLIRELPTNPRTSLFTSPTGAFPCTAGRSTRKNQEFRHTEATPTPERGRMGGVTTHCDIRHRPPTPHAALTNARNPRLRRAGCQSIKNATAIDSESVAGHAGTDYRFRVIFGRNARTTPWPPTWHYEAPAPRGHLLAQDHSLGVHSSFGAIRTSPVPRGSRVYDLCMLRSRSMGLLIPHVGEPLRSGPVVARGTGIRGPYRMGDTCTAGQFWFAAGSRSPPRPSR
ncbi:hypothetical protein HDA45_006409 [Amycolatopsis umgeniensis]|uniref:Uncharacterized protein n=1 Tax=Amycolatopsis umgeniensis TaxID=336628 RepID=A0A841BCM8_9PSEU|nr:hypothetical protein [Amycolatopsis umgeniensis]